MDLKKIFADALAELPKDATPEQLVAYIQAKAEVEAAIEGKPETPDTAGAAAASADAQEPAKPPTPDDANPGTPAANAATPPTPAPCADPPPPPAGDSSGDPNPNPPQGGDPKAAAGEAVLEMLTQATGMDAAACIEWVRANMDAIANLAKSGAAAMTKLSRDLRIADGQVAALAAKLAEYAAKDEQAKKDAETAKRKGAEAQVNALIECGRALDTQREDLVGLAIENPERFERIAKTMPQIVPTGRVAAPDNADKSGVDDVDEASLSDDERGWFKAFDVQLKSSVPDPKQRRALAAKALRERMTRGTSPAPTNGRA